MMAELKELVGMTPSFEQTIKPAQEKLAESIKAKAEVAGAEKAMLTQAEADRQKSYQQAGEAATQAVKTSPVFEQKEEVFKETNKPFIPTQDDAKDVAALYSLVNVVGMALGAGGKQNSMQAMHAMNGMLEGYQKGRQDLYKKEKDKFDVNMKNLKTRYDMLDKQLKDVMTLAQTDREAARQAADVAFAQSGANFYKQMADKIGIAGLYEYHKQAYDAANKLFAEQKRLEADADKRAHQKRMEELAARRVSILEGKVASGGGAGGGKVTSSDRYGFGDIIATNLNEAVGTIANIVNLPFDVTSGIFQGRNTTSLLFAPLGALTNKLTTEDVQRYNKEIKNFGKFASRVVSGGRVVPASVQKDFEDQFVIREGDSPLSVLTSLAQMRQTIERAAEVKLQSAATDPGLKTLYSDGLKVVRESIPFTVNDINKFANQRDQNKTFVDLFNEYGFSVPQTPTPTSPQPAPSTSGALTAAEQAELKALKAKHGR